MLVGWVIRLEARARPSSLATDGLALGSASCGLIRLRSPRWGHCQPARKSPAQLVGHIQHPLMKALRSPSGGLCRFGNEIASVVLVGGLIASVVLVGYEVASKRSENVS